MLYGHMGCLIKSQRDFKILRIVFRHHRKGHFEKKKHTSYKVA